MHTQDAQSTEYVRVAVDANVDVTGLVVQMAFPATGVDPVSGDWNSATWETDTSTTPPTYYARCLVGPVGGEVTLVSGVLYDTYVKIQDSPEIVVRNTGALAIL